MNKNFLLILALLMFISPAFSAPEEKFERAGTPAGFYDDIDPDSLEKEDKDEQETSQNKKSDNQYNNEEEESYHQFSESVKPTKNYSEIYNSLEMPTYSYLHNIDPDEFYDVKNAAWSIYPLLRLNSAIYFKDRVIEPGYYLLTPREHKGKWYMLFKQNGKVVHIIPVYDRGYTPAKFYDEHIPKPKLTKTQKIHMKILSSVGKRKHSMRQEPVKSYLEVNDLDNYFISIIIYYGGHRYSTLFRTIRL